MAPPKKELKRPTISVRIPEFVLNDSKSIPNFRKSLEQHAIVLHSEWLRSKEKVVVE